MEYICFSKKSYSIDFSVNCVVYCIAENSSGLIYSDYSNILGCSDLKIQTAIKAIAVSDDAVQ